MPTFDGQLSTLGLREEGTLFVDGGREVGLAAGDFGVCVGWLDVRWEGSATPATTLRDVVHLPFPTAEMIAREVAAARAKRLAELLTCTLCSERFTPGQMSQVDESPVCHDCAETKLGVVY